MSRWLKPKPWVFALVLALTAAVCLGWLFQTTRAVRSEARKRFFEQYNQQQLLLATQASQASLTDLLDSLRAAMGARLSEIDLRQQVLEAHRDLESALGRALVGGGS